MVTCVIPLRQALFIDHLNLRLSSPPCSSMRTGSFVSTKNCPFARMRVQEKPITILRQAKRAMFRPSASVCLTTPHVSRSFQANSGATVLMTTIRTLLSFYYPSKQSEILPSATL